MFKNKYRRCATCVATQTSKRVDSSIDTMVHRYFNQWLIVSTVITIVCFVAWLIGLRLPDLTLAQSIVVGIILILPAIIICMGTIVALLIGFLYVLLGRGIIVRNTKELMDRSGLSLVIRLIAWTYRSICSILKILIVAPINFLYVQVSRLMSALYAGVNKIYQVVTEICLTVFGFAVYHLTDWCKDRKTRP